MKNLFLSNNFPPEVNTPSNRTYEHCRAWVNADVEVTLITCAPNSPKGKMFDGYLKIMDEVSGSQNSVQLRYYLHPEILIKMHDSRILLSTSIEKLAKIRTDQNVQDIDTTYYDKYGSSKIYIYLLITGTTLFSSMVSTS
jgi:hypothetical protein